MNYTFFVKPTCFWLIQEDQWQILDFDQVDYDYIRQILTFFKPFLLQN